MGASDSKSVLGAKSTAKSVVDLFGGQEAQEGKIAIVTGGNSGIGTESVKQLVYAGCQVIVGSRSVENGNTAMKEAGIDPSKVTVVQLELDDLASVGRFAEECNKLERIDFLLANAGIMALPKLEYTKHGFERQVGVNHHGHLQLIRLLLDKMKAQDFPSRIVAVSSMAHAWGNVQLEDLHFKNGRKYGMLKAYGQSKAANILMIRELADQLGVDTKITCLSLHPGVIKTNLGRHVEPLVPSFIKPLLASLAYDKTIPQGAATSLTALLDPSLTSHSGSYLHDCKLKATNKHAADASGTLRKELWKVTIADLDAALAAAPPSNST